MPKGNRPPSGTRLAFQFLAKAVFPPDSGETIPPTLAKQSPRLWRNNPPETGESSSSSIGDMQQVVRPAAAPDGAADRLAQPAHTAGLIAAAIVAPRLLWPLPSGTGLFTQGAP